MVKVLSGLRVVLGQGVGWLMTRADALDQLAEVSRLLAAACRELADIEQAELQAKTQAWFSAEEDTLKARDRIADFNALNLSVDVIKLKGEIRALEAEREYLLTVIHYTPMTVPSV